MIIKTLLALCKRNGWRLETFKTRKYNSKLYCKRRPWNPENYHGTEHSTPVFVNDSVCVYPRYRFYSEEESQYFGAALALEELTALPETKVPKGNATNVAHFKDKCRRDLDFISRGKRIDTSLKMRHNALEQCMSMGVELMEEPASRSDSGKQPWSKTNTCWYKDEFTLLVSKNSHWLNQIAVAESAGLHSVSLGLFKIALEVGCNPLPDMFNELKTYVKKHNLLKTCVEETDILIKERAIEIMQLYQRAC